MILWLTELSHLHLTSPKSICDPHPQTPKVVLKPENFAYQISTLLVHIPMGKKPALRF